MLSPIAEAAMELLPNAPHPDTSERYMFIDTKKVIHDMADLGYVVAGFRFPQARTKSGTFALHEVDFRRPGDVDRPNGEAPRIIFHNSYDGSKRAKIVAGVIRFICSNGLVTGSINTNESFLHLGDYEEALMARLRQVGEESVKTFDKIESFRKVSLDKQLYLDMAEEGARLRFPVGEEDPLPVDPEHLLMPRRWEDRGSDLWTNWNKLQENLLKGGIPLAGKDDTLRTTRPLNQIQKSFELNEGLWALLEKYAEMA